MLTLLIFQHTEGLEMVFQLSEAYSIVNHWWLADLALPIGSHEVVCHTHEWLMLIGHGAIHGYFYELHVHHYKFRNIFFTNDQNKDIPV